MRCTAATSTTTLSSRIIENLWTNGEDVLVGASNQGMIVELDGRRAVADRRPDRAE